MAANKIKGRASEEGILDKTLELVEHIADKEYGLKLIPKDYACEKCDALQKDKSDLQTEIKGLKVQLAESKGFIQEISKLVKLPQDSTTKSTDFISLDFQKKMKTHLKQTMTEYNDLQQFVKKPVVLADLMKSSAAVTGRRQLTPKPKPPQLQASRTRKRKNPGCCQQDDGSKGVNLFRINVGLEGVGDFKARFHNVSHAEGGLKEQVIPDDVVLPVIGTSDQQLYWESIDKMRQEVITFRLTPATSEDDKFYDAVFKDLSSNKALGVIGGGRPPLGGGGTCLLALNKEDPVPTGLLPFAGGPGIPEPRVPCLLAIVKRVRKNKMVKQ